MPLSRLEQALGDFGADSADVVVGGPPCQGFSQIGKRQLDDERNELVFEFCRAIEALRPKYFVFENVPGLARGDHEKFLKELRSEFKSMGYRVGWPARILNAEDYEVAQSRKRIFIVGSREDQPKAEYPSEHYNVGFIGNGEDRTIGVKEAICDLEEVEIHRRGDGEVDPQRLDYSGYRKHFDVEKGGHFDLCHNRSGMRGPIFNHIGSDHQKKSIERFAATEPGETEEISRFHKLHPEKPSNTLRAGTARNRGAFTAARPIHYSKPRCISVREAARIHSFPDWFRLNRTIWHGFRQVGNSVVPFLGKKIAEQIRINLDLEAEDLPIYDLPEADEGLLRMSMSRACEYFDVPEELVETRDTK
jgi:DNA (cytosine-5)-methyltransferase 1